MPISRSAKINGLLGLFASKKVVADDLPVKSSSTSATTGDGENQVVYLTWEQEKVEFNCIITEDGLAHAEIHGKTLEVEDHDGDTMEVSFLSEDNEVIDLTTMSITTKEKPVATLR